VAKREQSGSRQQACSDVVDTQMILSTGLTLMRIGTVSAIALVIVPVPANDFRVGITSRSRRGWRWSWSRSWAGGWLASVERMETVSVVAASGFPSRA
jgi:hypothetical protein